MSLSDLHSQGVIDPAKVVKNSLLYGSSIASILLSCDYGVIHSDTVFRHEHEEIRI